MNFGPQTANTSAWCMAQNAVRKLQLQRATVLYVQFVVVPFSRLSHNYCFAIAVAD